MNRKFLLTALTVAAALVLTVLPVCAAPVDMGDGTLFDAAFYAQRYPDVVAVFGSEPQMLYLHYTMFGKNEGRIPYQQQTPAATTTTGTTATGNAWSSPDSQAQFDPVFYANKYPDVAAVYGNDPNALYQHYITLGFYEGRPGHEGGQVYVSEKNMGKYLTELINKVRVGQELYKLTWEFELDNAALIRCKELKVQFEHNRPDGKGYDTVYPGWATGKDHYELICRGKNTPADVVDWWQDHRHDGAEMRKELCSNRYSHGGGACWTDPDSGVTYWCFLLGRRDHYTDRPGVHDEDYYK